MNLRRNGEVGSINEIMIPSFMLKGYCVRVGFSDPGATFFHPDIFEMDCSESGNKIVAIFLASFI